MSKLEKLCAAYEQFGHSLDEMGGHVPETWIRMCTQIRSFVESARKATPRPTPSQITTGLEQGWRDMLGLLSSVPKEQRSAVAKAWFDACANAYPEFLTLEEARLARVLERGRSALKLNSIVFRMRWICSKATWARKKNFTSFML